MTRLLFASLVVVALVAGCHKDKLIGASCPETVLQTTDMTTTSTTTMSSTQSAFDINNVSVLEATDELYDGADAVILDHDPASVPDGGTWRVGSVDVLLMVASIDFQGYPQSVGESSVGLAIQVWDARTPLDPAHPAYELHQTLDVSKLTWTPVTISTGTFMKAWWTFDFSNIIPKTGMNATQYLVGVKWDASLEPQIGYSNFNRPCDRNWTRMTSGIWTLNSTNTGGSANSCNWPMVRVNSEVTTLVTTTVTVPVTTPVQVTVQRDQCDPNASDIIFLPDGGVWDGGVP